MFTFVKSVLSDFIAKNIYKKYYTQNEKFINTDRYIYTKVKKQVI